jgi:hypothetical protein
MQKLSCHCTARCMLRALVVSHAAQILSSICNLGSSCCMFWQWTLLQIIISGKYSGFMGGTFYFVQDAIQTRVVHPRICISEKSGVGPVFGKESGAPPIFLPLPLFPWGCPDYCSSPEGKMAIQYNTRNDGKHRAKYNIGWGKDAVRLIMGQFIIINIWL